MPYEAIQKIKQLEKQHQTRLTGFHIMAPAKAFRLKNADDPLLFAPMGNGYFYLIHKWGNDLHPLRRLMMWPLKNLEHFIFSMAIMSILLTSLLPESLFSQHEQTGAEFAMIAFFMFKWLGGMAIFYGFKKGKNFNSAIWKSTYFNA